MAFYPGQKVVFIGWDIEDGLNRPCPVIKGSVYIVRAVYMGHYYNADGDFVEAETLRLVGIDTDYGFAAYGFRPVVEQTTDISIFNKLLKSKKLETV